MNAEITSIKIAYEEEGMSPEDIASDRDLEVGAVKTALMQSSSQYRKACGREESESDGLNFGDDDLRRVNQVILDLALGAEDEHLRLKAAMYVRDDKKGRKEVVKGIAGQNFNILMINEQLRKGREVSDRIIKKLNPVNV